MKRGAMNCLMGGQAGSESKGKMSALLMDKFNLRVIAGNMSPNAGHTVIKGGIKHITYHIPAGVYGVRNPKDAEVILGPASIINPSILMGEIERLEEWGVKPERIMVDDRATVITQDMIRKEQEGMTKIGSTAQGVGEARCAAIMRINCVRAGSIKELKPYTHHDTSKLVRMRLEHEATLMYEMSQGFDLCQLHGIDPVYCTSRVVSPMQALADMGVSAKYLGDVYAVIRPYPIRVNNRDGSSGPYPSKEITWEEVRERCGAHHDITEITTTTKLTRRVFEFAWERIRTMVNVCAPDFLVLQFANYLDWKCYGVTDKCGLGRKVMDFVGRLENETGVPVAYIGTGPSHGDMVDMRIDRLED